MQQKRLYSKYTFVALLLILLVTLFCSLSGAWFTAGDSTKGNSSDVIKLGSIGEINISSNSFNWTNKQGNKVYATEQAKTEANDTSGEVRAYIMPGDKFSTGTVTISYDNKKTATQSSVWYLIKQGSKYYTINANGEFVEQTTKAEIISAGTENKKTVNGSIVSITTESGTYKLDGSTSSDSIDNSAQNKYLSELGATAGVISLSADSLTYNIAIIQLPNISTEKAFTELKNILDAM